MCLYRPSHFSKLDLRENRLRQRTKLLDNPQGSVHEEASRRSETEEHDGVEGEGVGLPRDRVAPPSLSESVGGSEEASLTSDELTESLVTIEPTSEQEQGWSQITEGLESEDYLVHIGVYLVCT